MVVYLVPIGRGRFELYSEPPDEPSHAQARDGVLRRQIRRTAARWHDMVHAARTAEPARGWLARSRDALVRRLAESVAQQRTLWALRHGSSATTIYPADLEPVQAQSIVNRSLARARRYHLRWLIVDALLESYRLVEPLLDADKEAIAGKDSYDDDYFEKFFARVKPMLEKRIADAITATASVVVGAWEAAGKPALTTEIPRTVQKVKK